MRTQAKTLAANEVVLKAAEQKAAAALSKVRAAPTMSVLRKPLWFERFSWFISRCAGVYVCLFPALLAQATAWHVCRMVRLDSKLSDLNVARLSHHQLYTSSIGQLVGCKSAG
jgi:hypothetical protein